MKYLVRFFYRVLFLCFLFSLGPRSSWSIPPDSLYWSLDGDHAIRWDVTKETRLPHRDHIEMSGKQVSAIVDYTVDQNRQLVIEREVIWPTLRTQLKEGDPDYLAYRAYLRRTYSDSLLPEIRVDGEALDPGPIVAVRIDGTLQFEHAPVRSLRLSRTLFPSTEHGAFIEQWTLENAGDQPLQVEASGVSSTESETGHYGPYELAIRSDAVSRRPLAPGESLSLGIYFTAHIADNESPQLSADGELAQRQAFLNEVRGSLILDTPDPVLNRAFELAKVRTSESIFATKIGLVHSPGGGRYYAGVWANDQAEYAGPFFPFLGYETANEALLNAYRIFGRNMKPDYTRVFASFEMEGDLPCCSRDRGDAAMIAYGASRYALALGNREIAESLWPIITWGLEYSRRQTTREGVVASESDEMEGRIPTGGANLSTSSLAYGALRSASDLARSLGRTDSARVYDQRANDLQAAIESHFGAEIEGFETYRYFDGHQTLRHWAVLPITMGILDRAGDTIEAVFTTLWHPEHGLEVEKGSGLFWDRGTLYALRAAFNAGRPDQALRYLNAYTRTRLLGRHVPYPVEAWPEGDEAHLAAESALYTRIITEGLFGIAPTGLRSFDLKPGMPGSWERMALRNIRAFEATFDIEIDRSDNGLQLVVSQAGNIIQNAVIREGETVSVILP